MQSEGRTRAAILGLYSALVGLALGATPLSLDEIQYFGNVRSRTWTDLIQWVQISPGGVPVPYLIQEATVRAFGLSMVTARLPFAIASLAAAAMMILVCKRIVPESIT